MPYLQSAWRTGTQMGAARGDPFVHKRIFGGIKGLLSGGLPGAVGGFLAGGRTRTERVAAVQQAQNGRLLLPPTPGGQIVVSPTAVLPGGRPFISRARAEAPVGAGCPKGFHLNKSDYFTKDGFVAAGTKCVRNRSRNFTNQRALRRATSRVTGFARQVKRSRKSLRALSKI